MCREEFKDSDDKVLYSGCEVSMRECYRIAEMGKQ
jgi:hypothetical protein